MGYYSSIVFPMLCRLDPETAHEKALTWLERAQSSPLGRRVLKIVAGRIPEHPVRAFGLTIPNVLGVAAGFDKDARVAPGLGLLGFGHVEVGTLTPQPQGGNPKPRVFRCPEQRAIINRMGFPNCGAQAAAERLRSMMNAPGRPIIGVSLGKQRDTPLHYAAGDYKAVMKAVYPWADYLAVNVSSPNTPGLRELQGVKYLDGLLQALAGENQALSMLHGVRPRPLLVKIAPDLTWAELDDILGVVLSNRFHGVIATNTTLSREGVVGLHAKEEGGLSGRPLAARSNEIIAYIHRQTAGRLPIIGAGGVETAADVLAKLDAGATLVQMYTGLVYRGPSVAGCILRGLARSS